MKKTRAIPPNEAVLILAPLADDEAALAEIVEAEGERSLPVSAANLEGALASGAGCLMMTEDALALDVLDPLLNWSAQQPGWSALPVLLLTRDTALLPYPLTGVLQPGHLPGLQITLLRRPSAPEVLRMAVRNAMDVRRRQYVMRDQMAELKDRHKEIALLGRELQHRAKNSLTRISVILRQTWLNSESPDHFIKSVERRISATARGLDLMSEKHLEGADLAELFHVEARAVFGQKYKSRLVCEGEDISLNYHAALALHLAAHELTTNALKYGAFSADGGTVTVSWRRRVNDGEEELDLVWEERGGPPVSEPEKKGVGSTVIEQALALQVGGYVEASYRSEGLRCRFVLPMAGIRA